MSELEKRPVQLDCLVPDLSDENWGMTNAISESMTKANLFGL